MANTYTLISSVTVGSGGASSIDFTSIPATYTDLCLVWSGRSAGSDVDTKITFNSEDLKLNDETWDILTGKKDKEINIKNCREFYIRNLCEKSGYKISANKKINSLGCKFLKA